VPELPEVETVRAGVARHVLGRQVRRAVVHHPRAARRHDGGGVDLAGRLTGRTLTAAVRRGKYLWLTLDGDDEALLIHLGMSGQLLIRHPGPGPSTTTPPPPATTPSPPATGADSSIPATPATAVPMDADSSIPAGMSAPAPTTTGADSSIPATHTVPDSSIPAGTGATPAATTAPGVPPDPTRHLRAQFELSDGARLDFVDQRTFGHLLAASLVPTADGGPGGFGAPLPALPLPVAHIARDPLDPHVDLAAVARRMRRRRTEVKRALLDQELVSGIGNIYADEALWRAKVHPRRATDRLPQATAVALLEAAAEVMRDALAAGGTSFDALYVDVDGASGYFARSLDAYGRAGLPCRRCGALIRRETFMNRSSAFCPRCQRAPRG